MDLSPQIHQLIDLAIAEDLVGGDLTTDAIFDAQQQCSGVLLAKSPLVLAGASLFTEVMRRFSSDIELTWVHHDGDWLPERTVVAQLEGPVRSILKAERTALNFMQRMSGVATLTRSYSRELEGSRCVVADTRKTLPGWRGLDKYSVRCGGGANHRFNLCAGVMIKDNHIAAAGTVAKAVERCRALAPHTVKIEVEVDTFEQLGAAIAAGADIIMLDNMSTAEMKRCVDHTRAQPGGDRIVLEASGGITIERLKEIAAVGVDVISVGALTHSAVAADLSLDLNTPKADG